MHIGQFACSKKYRSSKRPCSPGQQCSEALQIVPPGGHLPEKVTIWSMPRKFCSSNFSPVLIMLLGSQAYVANKVRCLARAKGRQKYEEGGGRWREGRGGNRGGAIRTTWLAEGCGDWETWDSTNTFLSCLTIFALGNPTSLYKDLRL